MTDGQTDTVLVFGSLWFRRDDCREDKTTRQTDRLSPPYVYALFFSPLQMMGQYFKQATAAFTIHRAEKCR
jgi:hypothetical protein